MEEVSVIRFIAIKPASLGFTINSVYVLIEKRFYFICKCSKLALVSATEQIYRNKDVDLDL